MKRKTFIKLIGLGGLSAVPIACAVAKKKPVLNPNQLSGEIQTWQYNHCGVVLIYNRALTAEEVAQNYEAMKTKNLNKLT